MKMTDRSILTTIAKELGLNLDDLNITNHIYKLNRMINDVTQDLSIFRMGNRTYYLLYVNDTLNMLDVRNNMTTKEIVFMWNEGVKSTDMFESDCIEFSCCFPGDTKYISDCWKYLKEESKDFKNRLSFVIGLGNGNEKVMKLVEYATQMMNANIINKEYYRTILDTFGMVSNKKNGNYFIDIYGIENKEFGKYRDIISLIIEIDKLGNSNDVDYVPVSLGEISRLINSIRDDMFKVPGVGTNIDICKDLNNIIKRFH